MTTTYELYTNDEGTPVAVGGTSPAIVERVENLENESSATKSELAGKEDKGVCLPLTGGSLTGTLFLNGGGHLKQDKGTPDGYGYVILSTKDEAGSPNSCSLYLSNPESSDEGSMILRYTDGQGTNHELSMQGSTDEIYWNKRPVETISKFRSDYIRYSNGLQIAYNIMDDVWEDGSTISFGAPFSVPPVVVATAVRSAKNVNIIALFTTTTITLRTNWSDSVSACFIAIGRWK